MRIRVCSISLLFLLVACIAFAQQPDAAHDTPDAVNTDSMRARDGVASVPHFVRFSGVVRDDAGNPRTSVVGLTFALYDQNDGGAAIWQETQNVTLDDAGRYNVLLGATTLRGLPMAPFVSGEARFIGVRVVEENAVEQPRVRLVSVPYALTAGDAQSLGGRPVTDFALTKAAAMASGDSQAAGLPTEVSGAVSSAANTVNLLAKFTSLDTVGDSQIFDNGTNVGIGTVSPGTKLDVSGAVNSAGYSIGGGLFALSNNNQTKIFSGTAGTVIYDNTGGTPFGSFSSTGLNVTGNLQAATFNATTGFSLGGSLFAISNNNQTKFFSGTAGTVVYDNTGAVALGNFTPSGLFVTGSLNATTTVNATTGYNLGGNLFALFAGNQARFYSGSAGTVIYDNTGAIPIGTFTAGGLAVVGGLSSTAGGNLAASAGNVGIGTPVPITKLDVAGSIRSSTGGFVFPDATVQTTKATLTGVTTSANSGLTGGGLAGTLALSLLTTCTQGQVLQWSGTAWVCTTPVGGGGLTLPFTGTTSSASGAFVITQSNAIVLATDPTFQQAMTSIPGAIVGVSSATSNTAAGVVGFSSSPDSPAIIGWNGSTGATTQGAQGVIAQTDNPTGTALEANAKAVSGNTVGLKAHIKSPNGVAIQGDDNNGTGTAGLFNGKVQVNGTVTIQGSLSVSSPSTMNGLTVTGSLVKPGGSFKIDHPLDPAGKFLYHSFVESPDMMNIYNGVVTLDNNGQAWIAMPNWFEALNMDFRYQLTAMGRPAPNLFVAREISGNRFKISGGTARGKVSWQVTGIRHDAWADANRIPVEVEKPANLQGTYLHPELIKDIEKKVAKK